MSLFPEPPSHCFLLKAFLGNLRSRKHSFSENGSKGAACRSEKGLASPFPPQLCPGSVNHIHAQLPSCMSPVGAKGSNYRTLKSASSSDNSFTT